MTLSQTQIRYYISEYFSWLVEDTIKREKMIANAQRVVRKNIEVYGLPTEAILQNTLGEILDNQARDFGSLSLQRDITGDGFTLEQILTSGITAEDEVFRSDTNSGRGQELLEALKSRLKEEYGIILGMLGGEENSVDILDRTRLTPEDILNWPQLQQTVLWLNQLPQESRLLYDGYRQFQKGLVRINPIRTLNDCSKPILEKMILDVHTQQIPLAIQLKRMGLWAVIKNTNGVSGLVYRINPGLVHQFPGLRKWKRGDESIERAINIVSSVLYELPGYKAAEQTGNRDEQVKIISQLIRQESKLQEYFYKNGLGSLMNSLIDPTGQQGLKKAGSPKALLEFYSGRKGLGWFDRTEDTYVQAWRIWENGKWQQGGRSVELGIEAIEDVLYELPGYKAAEQTGNRDEQVKIISQLIRQESKLQEYFYKNGLGSLMTRLIDPTGQQGLKKTGSPKALLEFYSDQKGLNLFNQNYSSYLDASPNGKLRVVYNAAPQLLPV